MTKKPNQIKLIIADDHEILANGNGNQYLQKKKNSRCGVLARQW